MQVRARRGVCIGVGRHLLPGDTEDLEAAQVAYLVSIGAVEVVVPEAPAEVASEPSVEVVKKPRKAA